MSIFEKIEIEAMDEKELKKVAGGFLLSTPRDYAGALMNCATNTEAFQPFKYHI